MVMRLVLKSKLVFEGQKKGGGGDRGSACHLHNQPEPDSGYLAFEILLSSLFFAIGRPIDLYWLMLGSRNCLLV